jgi:hypothetical protein
MAPPAWALWERELLRANTAACREFFAKYFDERGFLLCVERWGGNDGPDDAMESCVGWPLLHALGADDVVLEMVHRVWEGHLRQYTLAKTTHVPFARDGMYYKEFPVMFDWLHNGEGLGVFNLLGLSAPDHLATRQRIRRYAGFYRNEDPDAPNYDPEQKIIRSLFTGSRGPLLRPATALDWAGDPIEVGHRFQARHGERTYAYMLDHEPKYKEWLLEYVDAWVERARANGGILPSKIGLDGTIGGPAGKWYAGVYGWGFSVVVPQTGKIAHRSTVHVGMIGFCNAFLLTGDAKYLDVWRNMLDALDAQRKAVDGRWLYPHNYGDNGWYNFLPQPYRHGALELWYGSRQAQDRQRLPDTPWLDYLEGRNPRYPEEALQADFERIRQRVAAMRADTTTPDTRLSDDPMFNNPCSVTSLVHLMLGGILPAYWGGPLHCAVRYFDPERRRAGLPEEVGALVETLADDEIVLTLVNIHPVEPRELIVQAGAYGEHQFTRVTHNGRELPADTPHLTVWLEPGAGEQLTLRARRYANPPTLAFPWASAR